MVRNSTVRRSETRYSACVTSVANSSASLIVPSPHATSFHVMTNICSHIVMPVMICLASSPSPTFAAQEHEAGDPIGPVIRQLSPGESFSYRTDIRVAFPHVADSLQRGKCTFFRMPNKESPTPSKSPTFQVRFEVEGQAVQEWTITTQMHGGSLTILQMFPANKETHDDPAMVGLLTLLVSDVESTVKATCRVSYNGTTIECDRISDFAPMMISGTNTSVVAHRKLWIHGSESQQVLRARIQIEAKTARVMDVKLMRIKRTNHQARDTESQPDNDR
jgi:hypothetical protein